MIYVKAMRDYAVTFGDITLHLEEYRITGGCLLREQGTAAGDTAVAAVYPKGTRVILTGKIAPPFNTIAAAAAALDAALRGGLTRTLSLGYLTCAGARLIGYTFGTHETAADVTLIFYTQTALTARSPE